MPLTARPRDVTEQVLEFAERGRLVAIVDPARHRNPLTPFVALAAVLSAVVGGVFASLAVSADSNAPLLIACGVLAVAGLPILVAGAGAIHRRAASRDRLEIRPGAVLPPDLVRVGNWIHRAGAWVRVDEVGRDGGGRVNVLVSTGEVVHLDAPVTIAGGPFRPTVDDEVESLRR